MGGAIMGDALGIKLGDARQEGGRREGGKRMSTRIRVFHLLAELLDADYCLYLTFWKLFSFFRDVMVVARKLLGCSGECVFACCMLHGEGGFESR